MGSTSFSQTLNMRIYIFCLFYINLYGTFVGMCPMFCECRNGEVFCVNSGLSHVLQLRSSRHLRLAGNLTDCIHPSGFQLYTNVSVWNFQSNSTKPSNYGSFYQFRNLRELHLGFNQSALDCHLPFGLAIANMSQLNNVPKEVDTSLKWPNKLHLSDNSLKLTEKPTGLTSLEIIPLEDTQIKFITTLMKNTLKGLQRLKTLNLSGNRLSSFPGGIFNLLSSLSELMLDNNLLSEVKESDLKDLIKAKVLSLSHNRLSQIHPSAFRELYNLEVLKLNGNNISEIKKLTFRYCRNLRDIDLSDNAISSLDDFAFSGLSKLRSLRLNNNRLIYINPQVFGDSTQLQSLDLTGNVWRCDCRLLCLKNWLEAGRNGLVTVKCSHPETLKGQYLHTISSALIHSTGSPCSRAHTRVQSKPTHSGSGSRVTRQTCHDGDRYHTHRRVGRTAPRLMIRHREIGNALESKQYQDGSTGGLLTPQNKTAAAIVARFSNSTRGKATEENIARDACSYNQLVIFNISAVTVTSSSALIKWVLARNDIQNVHFRVMYDHFHTHTRFSRFVNVKQGTVCNLCDLRPSTPYLVCVESVVDEKVCHVASRDLCLGIITKPEEMSSPEPQTIVLFFTGVNAFAILVILALFVHLGCVLRKKLQADAISLLYARDKSISCAMCAGIPLSDRNSGMNTTSSHTGTYQQSDAIDVIDLPAAR
ncbi:TLR4 interactor with leucine rich repeats-like [Pygocentrus nattereri]|uniref:TLR4 interactor with leucine rich repeats-like n=1 Tax=Pygocentrus nattereri TaxID=42514 RepID=UPI0018919FC8|nr:TLR4 interactor with leucine rich repeats-like [Pygocentrus nattereri]